VVASLVDRALCGLRICDVANDRDVIALVSIGRRERQRNADDRITRTSPAPMPLEAPVMIATGGLIARGKSRTPRSRSSRPYTDLAPCRRDLLPELPVAEHGHEPVRVSA
jgi:hypothetical protein